MGHLDRPPALKDPDSIFRDRMEPEEGHSANRVTIYYRAADGIMRMYFEKRHGEIVMAGYDSATTRPPGQTERRIATQIALKAIDSYKEPELPLPERPHREHHRDVG